MEAFADSSCMTAETCKPCENAAEVNMLDLRIMHVS